MNGEVVAALALDIAAHRSQIAVARRAVVEQLTAVGIPSVVVDDIELVTSELVTNAIVHSADTDPIHVELAVSDVIAVAVSNVGSAADIPPVDDWRIAPPLPMSGRGLGIVRRLCDAVTVEQRGDRTVVVCRRRLPDGGPMP